MNVLMRINKLRLDRGWSVYQLANEACLPLSTVNNMFNRETLPSLTSLESMCTAFGISMSEFFEEELEPGKCNRKEFVRLYESLPASTRQILFDLMQNLSQQQH